MVSKKVVINNPTGLHLRPAGIFCNTAYNSIPRLHFSMIRLLPTPRVYSACLAPASRRAMRSSSSAKGLDEEEALAAW